MSRWREKSFARSDKGFTLFELLVAMMLLAIICSMIYSALNVSIRFSDKAEKKILNLTRGQGLMTLIERQIRNAWFDPRRTRVIISAQTDQLRIITGSSLLYPKAGLVLAYYRYEPVDDSLYYLEKKDFYNVDYDDDYLPPLEDMIVLMKESGNIEFAYEPIENKVVLSRGGKEYEFIPGCPQ